MSGRGAAFFDVDGTIVESNIVHYGVEIRTARMSAITRALWIATFLPRVPIYMVLDWFSRQAFQRAFYRLYRGISAVELEQRAVALFHDYVEPRIYREAERRIARHQGLGHRVVLVTGSLDAIVAPIAAHLGVQDTVTASLEARDGVVTGRLSTDPLSGHAKARAVRDFARAHNLDLAKSVAYGDSSDDVPMLGAAGRAAVINPGRRLRRTARRHGWEVLEWGDTG
jgi:HAD superfamily hydrolase (TIGR01490 family)